MNNLINVIYNCRKATYLIDKRLISKITFRESVELRVHLVGCSFCRLYVGQSQKINQMISQMLKTDKKPEFKLGDDFKAALQAQIEDELNKK
ncbi:hypothetical protein [Pedobacter sp. L105]|uniref:hypothetical protein n=1 Tax=Pedobacter sp. L105 TaxID=1641871 RepID=UPI00131D999A|nr:hypothetical protein [Pedobacter sp. L105]